MWLARAKKPNQPVSPVDWLETAERELSDTRKVPPRGSPLGGHFFVEYLDVLRLNL